MELVCCNLFEPQAHLGFANESFSAGLPLVKTRVRTDEPAVSHARISAVIAICFIVNVSRSTSAFRSRHSFHDVITNLRAARMHRRTNSSTFFGLMLPGVPPPLLTLKTTCKASRRASASQAARSLVRRAMATTWPVAQFATSWCVAMLDRLQVESCQVGCMAFAIEGLCGFDDSRECSRLAAPEHAASAHDFFTCEPVSMTR